MDGGRAGRGELIAGVCGALLFVFMFFTWYSVGSVETGIGELDVGAAAESLGVDTGLNAWQAFDFIDLVLLLAVVVSVTTAVMAAASSGVNLPVAGSALTAGLGVLATVLVLYRLINPPGDQDVERDIGAWLGLLACAGIAIGGWLAMQEEGGAPAGGLVGSSTADAGTPEPPPPPPSAPEAPPPPEEPPRPSAPEAPPPPPPRT